MSALRQVHDRRVVPTNEGGTRKTRPFHEGHEHPISPPDGETGAALRR